jgi:hypothetical protein
MVPSAFTSIPVTIPPPPIFTAFQAESVAKVSAIFPTPYATSKRDVLDLSEREQWSKEVKEALRRHSHYFNLLGYQSERRASHPPMEACSTPTARIALGGGAKWLRGTSPAHVNRLSIELSRMATNRLDLQ